MSIGLRKGAASRLWLLLGFSGARRAPSAIGRFGLARVGTPPSDGMAKAAALAVLALLGAAAPEAEAQDVDRKQPLPPSALAQQTNLKIKNEAVGICQAADGGGYSCRFEVGATNAGPGTFSGQITIKNYKPALGDIVEAGGGTWGCPGVGYEQHITCTSPIVSLQPGMTSSFPVRVAVGSEVGFLLGLSAASSYLSPTPSMFSESPPTPDPLCELLNEAEIWAPGIGDSNLSPADDRQSAKAMIPHPVCSSPPPPPCPPGQVRSERGACVLGQPPATETCDGPGEFWGVATDLWNLGSPVCGCIAGWERVTREVGGQTISDCRCPSERIPGRKASKLVAASGGSLCAVPQCKGELVWNWELYTAHGDLGLGCECPPGMQRRPAPLMIAATGEQSYCMTPPIQCREGFPSNGVCCPPGTTGSNGHCCPPGYTGTRNGCRPILAPNDSASAIPGGPTTIAPAQACPAGFDWTGAGCERRKVDVILPPPPGKGPAQPPAQIMAPTAPPQATTTTRVPSVQPTGCAKGQVLSNGHCCQVGKTWIGGRCIPPTAVQALRCPPGTKGTPPRCAPVIATRRTCPPGTRGTPPNCRPLVFKYQPKYRPQPRPQPQQTLR